MEIKQASLENLDEIEKLSKKFNFEINRNWKDLISSDNKRMFILLDNNTIVGFSGLIEHNWNNTIQISNIFIHPNYRNKDLAKKLIQYDIDAAKKTSSRCLIAEAPSLNPVKNLYEKMGFRKCGYNDRYYSNTSKEICIWMSIDLQ
ncbi:MAG: GNAT family N-acetyltransferase [Candidatus Woesearchaeota archaeon]